MLATPVIVHLSISANNGPAFLSEARFMRSLDQWFIEYSESHRNPTNKLIHFICVPAIMFCTIGLLWAIPMPAALAGTPWLNAGTVLIAISLLFYFSLSVPLALGMVATSAVMVWLTITVNNSGISLWMLCAVIFAIAWVLQFVGHAIEGKKPSFLKDVQFLLIGPLWVTGFLYDKLGISYRQPKTLVQ
jgi:uncharacterized membrane protein YGL010W